MSFGFPPPGFGAYPQIPFNPYGSNSPYMNSYGLNGSLAPGQYGPPQPPLIPDNGSEQGGFFAKLANMLPMIGQLFMTGAMARSMNAQYASTQLMQSLQASQQSSLPSLSSLPAWRGVNATSMLS